MMTSRSKERMVGIGPCTIPVHPMKAWKSIPLSRSDRDELWRIVGPTVQRCLDADLPLDVIYISVYLEGIIHGQGAYKEILSKEDRGIHSRRADNPTDDNIHKEIPGYDRQRWEDPIT